jgi:hypothetical protein
MVMRITRGLVHARIGNCSPRGPLGVRAGLLFGVTAFLSRVPGEVVNGNPYDVARYNAAAFVFTVCDF